MKIFYSAEMVVDANSYSKSPLKPKPFVEQALVSFGSRVEVVRPTPVTREQLYQAHSQSYVDGVLDLKAVNGFGNKKADVAKSLLWTSGSVLSAAYAALNAGIACSPTSGFHHAAYESGGGFCTFNGLMVTAIELFTKRNIRVAILDFDQHYGDGTDDILSTLGYQDKIVHYTSGGDREGTALGWEVYKRTRLKGLLYTVSKGTDLVIYQAGADCHVDDPLGGWLTTEQMKERDDLIIGFLRKRGIPVVWNLAGGYQADLQKVIQLHMNTLIASLNALDGKLVDPEWLSSNDG